MADMELALERDRSLPMFPFPPTSTFFLVPCDRRTPILGPLAEGKRPEGTPERGLFCFRLFHTAQHALSCVWVSMF